MAPSVTQFGRGVLGSRFTCVEQITLDTSYPAGGYIFTAQSFPNVSKIFGVLSAYASSLTLWDFIITPTFSASGGLTQFVVRLQVSSTGAEVATATNVSAFTLIAFLEVA